MKKINQLMQYLFAVLKLRYGSHPVWKQCRGRSCGLYLSTAARESVASRREPWCGGTASAPLLEEAGTPRRSWGEQHMSRAPKTCRMSPTLSSHWCGALKSVLLKGQFTQNKRSMPWFNYQKNEDTHTKKKKEKDWRALLLKMLKLL